jgi:hypothetical protein
MVAASLSILFITWHYVLLAILLTFFMRESLYRMIRPEEALEDLYMKQQASGKDKKR